MKGMMPEQSIDLLMARYDKDKDGRISFSELLQEIVPSIY